MPTRAKSTSKVAVHLPRSPLVEALIEVRWKLDVQQGGPPTDPAYPWIVGRLQDRLRDWLPYPESLPSTAIPDAMSPFVVKHRFRIARDKWPLVQVGPGIATMNFTEDYRWDTFKDSAQRFLTHLTDAHNAGGAESRIPLGSLLLRYINAIEFDGIDPGKFLRESLHTTVSWPSKITRHSSVNGNPSNMHILMSFPLADPDGSGIIELALATKDDRPIILMDLRVIQEGESVPDNTAEILDWLTAAHSVIEEWFFVLIQGDLHDQYSNVMGVHT